MPPIFLCWPHCVDTSSLAWRLLLPYVCSRLMSTLAFCISAFAFVPVAACGFAHRYASTPEEQAIVVQPDEYGGTPLHFAWYVCVCVCLCSAGVQGTVPLHMLPSLHRYAYGCPRRQRLVRSPPTHPPCRPLANPHGFMHSWRGNLDALDVFIEASKNINIKDSAGVTPLHYAAQVCMAGCRCASDVLLTTS